MARLPRIVVPGQALHNIQRGNNRQPCFFAEDDYLYYLESFKEAAGRYRTGVTHSGSDLAQSHQAL